jgi:hypothetical protein
MTMLLLANAKQTLAQLLDSIDEIDDLDLLTKIASDKSLEEVARTIRVRAEREFRRLAWERGISPKAYLQQLQEEEVEEHREEASTIIAQMIERLGKGNGAKQSTFKRRI